MDKIIARLKKKIVEIIKKSSNPEDPIHAKNTLEWMIKLEPQADEALKMMKSRGQVSTFDLTSS